MGPPLSDLYHRCHQSFQSLLRALDSPKRAIGDQILRKDVESELDKLKLWAGNVGAMHSGDQYTISLDYRLRESPFYRERITSFLNTLDENISRATDIVSNIAKPIEETDDSNPQSENESENESNEEDADSPWDVSSDESQIDEIEAASKEAARILQATNHPASALLNRTGTLELPKILEMMRFLISCLYKMPIRRPAALERLRNKLSGTASHYQHFDVLFVRDLFPEMEAIAATRLGRLISLRRHLLVYREEHTSRLQAVEPASPSLPLSQQDLEATVLEHQIPTIEEPVEEQAQSQVHSQQISLPSKATTHRNEPNENPETFLYPPSIAPSETSRASSYAVDHLQVTIPPIPRDHEGRTLTQFLCPYCSITQNIKSERAWKKHVFDDLRPYVCTYTGCSLQDHFFSTRNEWYQHEALEHRSVWHCNIDAHQQYAKQNDFIDHMSREHGSMFTLDQLTTLASMFRRPSRGPDGVCNLCLRRSHNLRSHVGRHLQRIALFALPRTNDEANLNSAEAQESHERSVQDHGTGSHKSSHPSINEGSSATSGEQDYRPELPNQDLSLPEDVFNEAQVPDSEDPGWDLVTTKFAQAREAATATNQSPLDRMPNLEQEERQRKSAYSHGAENRRQRIRRQLIQDADPRTCEWIFDSTTKGGTTFWNWLSGGSGILVIFGDSGTGKSTLIKYIADRIEGVLSASHRTAPYTHIPWIEHEMPRIATYFFGDSKVGSDTPESFLRSLLFQILASLPDVVSQIFTDKVNDSGSTSSQLKLVLDETLSHIHPSPCIFLIDGADTDPVAREECHDFLRRLSVKHRHLKICSALLESWRRPMWDDERIWMQDNTRLDIETLAAQSVKSTSHPRPDLISGLVQNAENSFLKLSLMVQIIGREEPPPHIFFTDIESLFRYALETLHTSAQARAARLLLMILQSPTPLRLSTLIMSDTKEDDVESQKRELQLYLGMNLGTATAYLRRYYCPFLQVVIDEYSFSLFRHQVYVSHEAISDYFSSDHGQTFLRTACDPLYNYWVYMCEALFKEAQLYNPVNHSSEHSNTVYLLSELEALTILGELGKHVFLLDSNIYTDAETPLLFRLRSWLSIVQSKSRDSLSKPNFWEIYLVEHGLVSFIRKNLGIIEVHGLLSTALCISDYYSPMGPNVEIVQLLLENSADPNESIEDTPAKTVWHRFLVRLWVRRGTVMLSTQENLFQVTRLMLVHGAETNAGIRVPTDVFEIKSVAEILKAAFNAEQYSVLEQWLSPEPNPGARHPTPSRISSPDPSSAPSSEFLGSDNESFQEERPVRIVKEALFEIEELRNDFELDSDVEVVVPDDIEDATSIKESTPSEPDILHSFENLRTRDSTDEDEETARQRYLRKKKRWSEGTFKRSRSVGFSSDSGDEVSDYQLDSSARRPRRRVRRLGDDLDQSDDSASESEGEQAQMSAAIGTSTRRKYRRHPQPDGHAPERPPSAYVIFSNEVRETLKEQKLSFAELARVLSEKWQALPDSAREVYEGQANTARDKYNVQLAEYKTTPQYEGYQKYLENFKKSNPSELEVETRTSTRSNSHKQADLRQPFATTVEDETSDDEITQRGELEQQPILLERNVGSGRT